MKDYRKPECVTTMRNTICEIADYISIYTGVDIANEVEKILSDSFSKVEHYINMLDKEN